MNTVICPLCEEALPVPKDKTRSEVLVKHLQEVKHNGKEEK